MIRATVCSGLAPDSSENGLLALVDQVKFIKPDWQIDHHHYTDDVDFPYDVYIGTHSFGASWARDQIKKFPNYIVPYWGIIDGMDYHWDETGNFKIPANVIRADSFIREDSFKRYLAWIPPSSAILNSSDVYKNYYQWSWHGNMPKNNFVIQTILKSIGSLSI